MILQKNRDYITKIITDKKLCYNGNHNYCEDCKEVTSVYTSLTSNFLFARCRKCILKKFIKCIYLRNYSGFNSAAEDAPHILEFKQEISI